MTQVDTLGTGTFCADDCLADAVKLLFPLTPAAAIAHLDLLSPRYADTAANGHFGRPGLPWNARIWPPRCGRLSCNIMH